MIRVEAKFSVYLGRVYTSFIFSFKIASVLTIYDNRPRVAAFTHSRIPRCFVTANRHIPAIFCGCANAKVFNPIVGFIPVYMIYLKLRPFAVNKPPDQPMR